MSGAYGYLGSSTTYPSLTIQKGLIVDYKENSINVEEGGTLLKLETENGITGGPITSSGTIDIEPSTSLPGNYFQPECGISRDLIFNLTNDGRINNIKLGDITRPRNIPTFRGKFLIQTDSLYGDCYVDWTKIGQVVSLDFYGRILVGSARNVYTIDIPVEITPNKKITQIISIKLILGNTEQIRYLQLELLPTRVMILKNVTSLDPITQLFFSSDVLEIKQNITLFY